MSYSENLIERKKELIKQLRKVKLPDNKESITCWEVGSLLGCSGVTVKNYISGNVSDGYLGEAILEIFKNKKMA